MANKKNRYEVAIKQSQSRNPHRVANPEFAQAMREIGRSSATTPHVAKPRKGTRAVRKEQAIKDFS